MHPIVVAELATERHTELLRFAQERRRGGAPSGPARHRSPGRLLIGLRDTVRAVVLPQPEPCCA